MMDEEVERGENVGAAMAELRAILMGGNVIGYDKSGTTGSPHLDEVEVIHSRTWPIYLTLVSIWTKTLISIFLLTNYTF
jgi:hypothetical protein